MIRKACFLFIGLVLLGFVVYWYAPGAKLPQTRTALNSKVTLQSVSGSQLEIIESINPASDVLRQRDFTGPLVVKPGTVRGDPRYNGVSEDSVLKTYTIDIPRFVRRIAVSKQVISHEGAPFSFPAFSAEELPITRRIGKHHVTVRKIWVGDLMRGVRGVVVLFDVTPGYMPYNIQVRDARGWRLADGTWFESGRGYRWFSSLGGKPAPRRLSLELTVAREKTAWVTFKNVPVSR